MIHSNCHPVDRRFRPQLTEVLLAVVVVGVLSSMAPAILGSLREDANRVMCGNNLRTIAFAILAHEDEYRVLPGPTRRMVQSPLAGDERPGASVPKESWPNMNVCMSLLLEDYLGVLGPQDPGPFLCRSNPATLTDPRYPAYIVFRTISTNPPNFFGNVDYNHPPRGLPEIVAAGSGVRGRAARALSEIWMIADIDSLNWTGTGGADTISDSPPPHDGGRNMVFFDGRLEYVTADENGLWTYPANSGQPESR